MRRLFQGDGAWWFRAARPELRSSTVLLMQSLTGGPQWLLMHHQYHRGSSSVRIEHDGQGVDGTTARTILSGQENKGQEQFCLFTYYDILFFCKFTDYVIWCWFVKKLHQYTLPPCIRKPSFLLSTMSTKRYLSFYSYVSQIDHEFFKPTGQKPRPRENKSSNTGLFYIVSKENMT